MHAHVGDHAVIRRHVARGGFDHRAAAERRQDAPAVVAGAPAVLHLEQTGDVAAGEGARGLDAVIQNGAGHAQRVEDARLHELLERNARRLIDDVGEDGVALVGVAHHLARRAERVVAAVRDIRDDLVDRLHLVGRGALHLAQPVAFAAPLAVHGNRPFQRFHRGDARRVHRQRAHRRRLALLTGQLKFREEIRNRGVQVEPALTGQNTGAQRGHRLAHRGDAEQGVVVHRAGEGSVAEAVIEGVFKTVRPHDRGAHAGKIAGLTKPGQICVKFGRIKHGLLLQKRHVQRGFFENKKIIARSAGSFTLFLTDRKKPGLAMVEEKR